MIFLIYMIVVILQQYKGISTEIPDPCPSDIKESTIVVDMCRTNSATEDKRSGSDILDSVLLRIMIRQDDCICRVTIENQIQLVYIGLGIYGGFTSSAPVESQCGLAVDINHIPDISTENIIAPIECIDNVNFRAIPLLQNSTVQFNSRITKGSFTRGYCMHIQRDSSTDPSQVLGIECDAPTATEQTTYQRITSDPTTETSSNDSVATATYLQTTDTLQSTTMRPKEDTIVNDRITENDKTVYIAVSAFSSTVALILLVVLFVTCIRYKALQWNVNKTNQNVNTTNQVEYSIHYCDLTNNIHNVPGQEYDIIDSNYNTTDDDRSQYQNNIVCMEGEYISVEPDGHLTTTMN